MKIGPLNIDSPRLDPAARSPAGQAGSSAAAPAVKPGAIDRIELSEGASRLLKSGTDSFDAEKVAAIRKAIEDKQFKIKHEVIAEKMITEAASFLQTIATKQPGE